MMSKNLKKTQSDRKKHLRHSLKSIVIKKKSAPCEDCGGSYPYYCMDLDHIDPKTKICDINFMVRYYQKFTEHAITEELKKCRLLCANCHRHRTHSVVKYHGRSSKDGYLIKSREILKDLKNKPCEDCRKSFNSYSLDFDHVRGKKEYNVSRLAYLAKDKLLAEIAKCDLVCACCHRKRTHSRMNDGISNVTLG